MIMIKNSTVCRAYNQVAQLESETLLFIGQFTAYIIQVHDHSRKVRWISHALSLRHELSKFAVNYILLLADDNSYAPVQSSFFFSGRLSCSMVVTMLNNWNTVLSERVKRTQFFRISWLASKKGARWPSSERPGHHYVNPGLLKGGKHEELKQPWLHTVTPRSFTY